MLYFMLCGRHPIYEYGDSQIVYKRKVTTIGPEKWKYPSYVSE